MASSLPLFAAWKLVNSFHHWRYQERGDGNMWLIRTTNVPLQPTTKFAIERSSRDEQLVHIRCCYSNKYLVRESSTSNLINAAADEPQEDISDWACTLFRPNHIIAFNEWELFHVQTGVRVVALDGYPPLDGIRVHRLGINLDRPTSIFRTRMRFANWDDFVILPHQVTLKGDNGKYLAAWRNQQPFAQYNFRFTGDDPADVKVHYEVSYHDMYYIRIKSLDPNVPDHARFWVEYSMNRPVFNNHAGINFMPIKVSDNQIALEFISFGGGGQQFCRRAPEDNLLYTNARSIVREARFDVGEPVLSREVYNVNFRLHHARIYDQEPLVMATFSASNDTSETHFRTTTFRFDETRERFWRGFVSLNLGVNMRFRAGIPLLAGTTITISANFNGEYEWGGKVTETLSLEDSYTFPIPPMTRSEARLLATRATCDVPFSYTVSDRLVNGRTRIYDVDGGVYTGVNNFNFEFQVINTPL